MYVNVYVPKSGGSVVPKSDVYKCSDPKKHFSADKLQDLTYPTDTGILMVVMAMTRFIFIPQSGYD